MDYVVELKKVSKIYDSEEVKVQALRDVDIKIKKGDFVSLMGPSGSGKSTLLHIIGALDKATSGSVRIDQTNLANLNDSEMARMRGKKIGFVFQFFNLYPTLTARGNVELPMMIANKDASERKERSSQLLKMVGLEERMSHMPSQLSGGQRQRVAIARALANDPAFILADEPTGNLDSESGKEIMGIFSRLNKEGKTVVIVTHDEFIASHSKRIIRIKDGRVVNG